jgi:hypothetical protein
MTNARFPAPWGRPLKIMSWIGSAICLGVSGLSFFSMSQVPVSKCIPVAVACVPLSILLIAAFFAVRSFQISGNSLLIRRLGWTTRVSLDRLVSIEHDPTAMKGSIRTFGNGGIFSFSGRFGNRKLGSYRAYVTDTKNSVVIRLATGVIVVSPDSPGRFVDAVKALATVR